MNTEWTLTQVIVVTKVEAYTLIEADVVLRQTLYIAQVYFC